MIHVIGTLDRYYCNKIQREEFQSRATDDLEQESVYSLGRREREREYKLEYKVVYNYTR